MMINKVTMLGHKDHGKSTLIGSLLIETKTVTEARLSEAKKISAQLGRPFEPGFILDSFSEEREEAMTIDTTRAQVKYKDAAFEFIDVPGHEELITNMISGASYASFALLVVSAKPDEGIRDQTKRHLFLAKMLGIRKLVVAVNKMDTIGYDQKAFDSIRQGITSFLETIGFAANAIDFIPVSAYNAENLLTKSKMIPWYAGASLMDAMYGMASRESAPGAAPPLRLAVQGILPAEKRMVVGKVITGQVKAGDGIVVSPSGKRAKVAELFVKGAPAASAKAGENVAMFIGEDVDQGIRGSVIFHESEAPAPAKALAALVFATKPMKEAVKLKLNGSEMAGSMKVLDVVNTATGKVSGGKEIPVLEAGNVRISLSTPAAAEPFSRSVELGRFVLYNGSGFSGIGIITKCLAI